MKFLIENIKKIEKTLKNPKTPQGEIGKLKNNLLKKRQVLNKLKEEKWQKENKINIYWSDDYSGMVVGNLSFYFGYEVTKCPTHKTQEACDEVLF